MPADPDPELARLVDLAERPRTHDWSLRATLVRYAQPEPQRVNDILDVVRRVDWALGKQSAVIEDESPALLNTLGGDSSIDVDAHVVDLLRAAKELDHLGDVLATWAVDRAGERPDAEVDRVINRVAQQLDALGVPREDRSGPPRGRRG